MIHIQRFFRKDRDRGKRGKGVIQGEADGLGKVIVEGGGGRI